MATHRYTCVGFSAKIDWKSIEFLLPMPVYRICSICGIVPDMIFSLECGHVFCPTCMHELMLNSPVVVCPFDKGSFEESRVSRDSSSQAYVGGCKSYCLNKVNGCNYVGAVSEMIEHYYSECNHHIVHCRSCKNPVARMNVLAHVRSGCKSDILASNQAPSATAGGGSDADASLSTLVSKIENLENVLLRRTNRLEEMLRERVSFAAQPPPPPALTSAVASTEQPDTTAAADTTTRPCEDQGQPDVVSTSSTSPSEASSDPKPVANGDAEVNGSPAHSRDESPSEPQANGLNCEPDDQAVVESTAASDAAEAQPSRGPDAFFTYVWVIKPFRKYRNAPEQVFTSDVLTVGENGYRMKLEGKFHDLGDSSLYLGLYLRIVKGPNDASLEWPFSRKCIFVLLHHKQRTRDVSYDLFALKDVEERQNAANTVLKRPKQRENDSIGLDKCLSVNQMLQSGFVKSNEFRVRFIVE
ncbi:hypothetical protein HPB50_006860 [Hyalomma asiaticum]|uniref:Uncharacterized protein n=1 Tax=Hyalomma asiaticum TaxID=266040 RepID=A0ACB7RJI1_HYAAI|nr:hypothetical protein HPB50_006860 [Hyalomma asiaticum]